MPDEKTSLKLLNSDSLTCFPVPSLFVFLNPRRDVSKPFIETCLFSNLTFYSLIILYRQVMEWYLRKILFLTTIG